ncbi:MAG: hypothetical protein KBH73_10945 [Syntrophobacterales bacterium]|nr:hypothetical protein [Syntrophobacterales bacterium]
MSQHFLERGGLPPGLTSFTRIRLGWMTKEQVRFVKPGETALAFLAPLAAGGETLAVKIPLSWGNYYLVENRQPVGFDRALPDSGILVLKVNPDAAEGYGTVKVMNANPAAPHFKQATYRPDAPGRDLFQDGHVAVIPAWQEGDRLGVLVTAPERGAEALKAARAVRLLMKDRGPRDPVTAEAKAAFTAFDFKRCIGIAGR